MKITLSVKDPLAVSEIQQALEELVKKYRDDIKREEWWLNAPGEKYVVKDRMLNYVQQRAARARRLEPQIFLAAQVIKQQIKKTAELRIKEMSHENP